MEVFSIFHQIVEWHQSKKNETKKSMHAYNTEFFSVDVAIASFSWQLYPKKYLNTSRRMRIIYSMVITDLLLLMSAPRHIQIRENMPEIPNDGLPFGCLG